MVHRITSFALLALATAFATTLGLPQNSKPSAFLKGWNELVKGNGLFNEIPNTIQAKSNNADLILDEFKLLVDQDTTVQTAYRNYRKLYKDTKDAVSGNVEVFKEKLINIARHNLEADSGRHSWWMGINQFTDMTPAELREIIGDKEYGVTNANSTARAYVSDSEVATPASFNSVANGFVPAVKNRHGGPYGEQFAVAAVVEISLAIKLNFKGMNTIPLSAQEIIDCQPAFCQTYRSQCTGTPIQKLMWWPHYKGLSGETGYPYNNPPAQGTCGPTNPSALLGEPIVSPGNSEETLKQLLVDNGAAIVSVYFSNSLLSEYASGVYPGSDCGSNAPNQVLTLVGYGNEGGQDYWLLKNSMGQSWGEQGYLRLARNGGNVCGILTGPAYAAKGR